MSAFTSIPVLDYNRALSSTTKPDFLAQLRDALINVGFLYLRNPPVSTKVRDALTTKALELFQLPLEKKLEIEMVNSPHFLGYSRLGAEITALKSDHREQFDVILDSLAWCFSFLITLILMLRQFATELPAPGLDEPLYRNICGPNQVLHPSLLGPLITTLLPVKQQTRPEY